MAEVVVKSYENVQRNLQYVIRLTPEHLLEYLRSKKVSLDGFDHVSAAVRTGSGPESFVEINIDNPIIINCYKYEQLATQNDI